MLIFPEISVVMGKESGKIIIIVQNKTFNSEWLLNDHWKQICKTACQSILLMNSIITVNDRKLQVDMK